MKRYSTFPKASALQIVKCHIQDTHCRGSLTPFHRCSLCILQPQPTGLMFLFVLGFFNEFYNSGDIEIKRKTVWSMKNLDERKYLSKLLIYLSFYNKHPRIIANMEGFGFPPL